MTITIERIASALGAKVSGIDLSKNLSSNDTKVLESLLLEHQVLFFRDQPLTPQQQARVAGAFGDLHIHPIYPKVKEQPEVLILDTALNDLRDNALWHTDVTFIKTPPLGSVLTAKQVPPFGGDTLWASSSAAYQGLSKAMQSFLEPLTAINDISLSFPSARFSSTPEALATYEKAKENNPPVAHPVVRVHPLTGEKGLFVSEGFTSHIVELSDTESRALLNFLFAHSTQPQYTVRWHWQANDVAFWDNRITQHYACDDYRPQRRIMHRATILGDAPYGVRTSV